jgi:hypothetical protein
VRSVVAEPHLPRANQEVNRSCGDKPLVAASLRAPWLLQFCILLFGGVEDRDIRVGVFPERKEILI